MARSRASTAAAVLAAAGAVSLASLGARLHDSAGTESPARESQHRRLPAADCRGAGGDGRLEKASLDHAGHIKRQEHAAALRLVSLCDATDVAVRSGRWSDPETWAGRSIPRAGARIVIQSAVTVAVDGVVQRVFDWVRVDGHLVYQPDVDTMLAVRTMVVTDTGTLTIGTMAEPVSPRVKAKLLFASRLERDRLGDPLDLAGGLISSGVVQMIGPRKDGHRPTQTTLRRGTAGLTFATAPLGWSVGDHLLIPGTVFGPEQDELRRITGRRDGGRTITLDRPLAYDHAAPAGVAVPVGNLTRNIELASLTADPLGARGHVMIMHVPTGTVFDGVSFLSLGRTDAEVAQTHPLVGADGVTVPTTDDNTVGRYAVHFHMRNDARRDVPPQVIRNSVVIDSPKFGIVNHGGHVVAENNVTFRVAGAHLVAENGSEIGVFRGNMAVRSAGSGDTPIQSRMNIYDLGHAGHGLWMQGFGVEVADNWLSGHEDAGIIAFGDTFIENGQPVFFDARNLNDPTGGDAQGRIQPALVSLHMARNVVAGSKQGVVIWTHKLDATDDADSLIEDLTVWNVRRADSAVQLAYTQNMILRNLRLIGPEDGGAGVDVNMFTGNLTIEGGSIVGFAEGLRVPPRGRNVVRNTVFRNDVDIKIGTANHRDRYVSLDRPVFERSDPGHVQIAMADLELPHNGDVGVIFVNDRIDLTDSLGRTRRLFFPSQGRDSVPFPTRGPAPLLGLSSWEIHQRFGIAPGGAVAPPEAVPLPFSNALAVRMARLAVTARDHTPERLPGEGYSHQREHFSQAAGPVLSSGWDVVPAQHGQAAAGRLVFRDTTPPKYMLLNCLLPLQIHPEDVSFGYRAMGMVVDKVGDEIVAIAHGQSFTDLTVDADGYVRVSFTVHDLSGNPTRVDLPLRVTDQAIRRGSNLEFFLQRSYCEHSGIDTVQADARRFYESGEWRVTASR
jgi:hypothetical protein